MITDPLDAVGNTTEAVTRGYAIRLGRARALILFDDFATAGSPTRAWASRSALSDPWVIAGLFIGGLMPFLFASLAMTAVGRVGGEVVEEVRRQFREDPGIVEGPPGPTTRRGSDRHGLGDQEHARAGADPDRALDRRRDHQAGDARRPADRTIVTGLFLAIAMTSGGGAWDNAKKLIEDGAFGGKGSEAHAAAVTGDTVGDPTRTPPARR